MGSNHRTTLLQPRRIRHASSEEAVYIRSLMFTRPHFTCFRSKCGGEFPTRRILWPAAVQVRCAGFKRPESATTSNVPEESERDSIEPAPVQQPVHRRQDGTVNSIYSFLKQICVSPPKSSCRTLPWVNGPVASYIALLIQNII